MQSINLVLCNYYLIVNLTLISQTYFPCQPSGGGDSQCLAGNFGKGKVFALGDCNGFTAMYVNTGGKKFSAGMQVEEYDWRQFVLNSLHWLSK